MNGNSWNPRIFALSFACLAPLGCAVDGDELDDAGDALLDPDGALVDGVEFAFDPPEAGPEGEALELDYGGNGDPAEPDLVGISSSNHAPVIRIRNAFGGTCTATVIAPDVAVTATQCLREGLEAAAHVEIIAAVGLNAGSVGAFSSHYMMSGEVYNGPFFPQSNGFRARDIAFIKFGAGTFDKHWKLDHVESPTEMWKWQRAVSYGGTNTQTRGAVWPQYYGEIGEYAYIRSKRDGNYATFEASDLGGPIITKINGEWVVHGVMSTIDGDDVYHAILTDDVHDHIMPVIQNVLPTLCVEAFEDPNYAGRSTSYCHEHFVGNNFKFDNFSDSFEMHRHDNPGWLMYQLSSLQLPSDFVAGLTSGHDNQTFQTWHADTAVANVPNLGSHGFDDAAESVDIGYPQWAVDDVSLRLSHSDKCFELAGNPVLGTPEIRQQACDGPADDQTFDLFEFGDYVQVRHASTGKCIGTPASVSVVPGTYTNLSDCVDGNSRQLWTMEAITATADPRDFRLRMRDFDGDGLCMAVWQGNTNNNVNVEMRYCSDSATSSQRLMMERHGDPAAQRWAFDEGSGTTLGNPFGANASMLGNPAWSTDSAPIADSTRSLAFDGAGDCLTTSSNDAVDFDGHDDFTVAMWIKPGTGQVDTQYVDNSLIEKWTDGVYPYTVRIVNGTGSNPGVVKANRYDGSSASLEGTTRVDDGAWHHVAFVKTGPTLSIYVDGQLDASRLDDSQGVSNDGPIYLGCRHGNRNYYSGKMDDVRIYDSGLSAQAVSALYNG